MTTEKLLTWFDLVVALKRPVGTIQRTARTLHRVMGVFSGSGVFGQGQKFREDVDGLMVEYNKL